MKKAVQIGAGNIGRGLNGFILSKNNYHITFLDISEEMVKKINNENEYKVIQKSSKEKEDIIKNFNAINILKDEYLSIKALSEAEIILISIGIDNLPKIKKLIMLAIKYRIDNGINSYLNIVAVENGINATDIFKNIILSSADSKTKEYIRNKIGFTNCAVDRIVPEQNSSSLSVYVEPFFEIIFDKKTWKGEKLDLVKYSSSLDKFIKRKLFMLNATHAFIAWCGIKKGYKYIYQFTKNKEVAKQVKSLLENFSEILINEFSFSRNELILYSKNIFERLSNSAIKDNVNRVGRGAIRKISQNDRFVTPIKYAIKNNLHYREIIKALAYVFSDIDFNDEEIREINNYIAKNSLIETIQKYTSLDLKISKEIENEVKKIL